MRRKMLLKFLFVSWSHSLLACRVEAFTLSSPPVAPSLASTLDRIKRKDASATTTFLRPRLNGKRLEAKRHQEQPVAPPTRRKTTTFTDSKKANNDYFFASSTSISTTNNIKEEVTRKGKHEDDSTTNGERMEKLLPNSLEISALLSLPQVELLNGFLVLLSSLLVAIGTLPTLPSDVAFVNVMAEDCITGIFFVEFFLRWYSQGQLRLSYLAKPLSIIDVIVVVLPVVLRVVHLGGAFSLDRNTGLINLRLLRILRLQRVLTDMDTFSKFEMALGFRPGDVRPYQLQLARVLLSLLSLLLISTGLIYTAEHDVNSQQIPDFFTALYFGLTTLTTVGFGDITPVTFQGRLVVCGSILAGVAILPAQAAGLVEALLEAQNDDKKRQSQRDNQNNNSNGNGEWATDGVRKERRLLVDIERSCCRCGAQSHWADALFCWNCGSDLNNGDDGDMNSRSRESFGGMK